MRTQVEIIEAQRSLASIEDEIEALRWSYSSFFFFFFFFFFSFGLSYLLGNEKLESPS